MYFNNKIPNLVDEKIVKYHFNKLYNNNLNSHMTGGNPLSKPLLHDPLIPNVQHLSYGLPSPKLSPQLPQQLPQLPQQLPQQLPPQLPQQLPQLHPQIASNMHQFPGVYPNYSQEPPNFFMKTFTLVKNYLIEFIKENYGFVIIITLLIILLYIRYVEVSKKKKNTKNII